MAHCYRDDCSHEHCEPCPKCDGDGWIEYYDLHRQRDYKMACECSAGERWEEQQFRENGPRHPDDDKRDWEVRR